MAPVHLEDPRNIIATSRNWHLLKSPSLNFLELRLREYITKSFSQHNSLWLSESAHTKEKFLAVVEDSKNVARNFF